MTKKKILSLLPKEGQIWTVMAGNTFCIKQQVTKQIKQHEVHVTLTHDQDK